MGLADALTAIAADWPQLSAGLTGDRRAEARRQLAAAVHGAAWRPRVLLQLLVGDQPDHPAWAALRSGARRTTLPQLDPESAALRLRWLLELDDEPSDAPPAEHDSTRWQDVAERAELRIWLAPMRPAPAGAEDVLSLAHHGDRVSPTFQFDEAGDPLAVVVEINRTLDARGDPWGAASWWLAPHAALHAIPADAVRHGQASDVLAAARATLPGE